MASPPAAFTEALRDRYVLGRALGHGGMATVFLARDLKHHREVAVKVLREELTALLGRERFLGEVALAAKLDHPHILTLIDSGEAAGTLYYVLPYVRGPSVRQRLASEQQLPLEDAVRIARQAAGALDYAHRQGVIHRDIKPENILLHEGEAMVTDFGIALAIREAAGERLTESGLSLGTPQYMSPEQATGGHDLTPRSDIFSLGAVVYEMLTGEPPFHGRTPQAVVARLMTERPASIRTVRETVPAQVEAAVIRALAKVPADRFPTGEAFAVALRDGMTTPAGLRAAAAEPARPGGLASAGRWLLALTVVAGFGLAVFESAVRRPEGPGGAAVAPGGPLVLISPFHFGDNDTLAGSIARSLSQGIVDSLATTTGLRVIAGAGDTPQADSLLRGAEVGLTVGGSVERRGGRMKAVGRVSAGASRIQLFAYGQEALPAAASVLEADLVERVVRFVRRYVGSEVRRRAVAAETTDSVARGYWSRAMAIIDAVSSPDAPSPPGSTADRLTVADSLLGEAIRRDPHWTGPHVARGWTYLEMASMHASEGQRDSARISAQRMAIRAADAAIRIAPAEPGAHELRGVALVGLWFEVPSDQADSIGREAERELRRAIALDLDVARAWEALGTYYLFAGRFEEATRAIAQALRADQFLLSEQGILLMQITANLNLERYADAQRVCARGARWYPLELAFLNCQYIILGWSASDLGSASRAWDLGSKAEEQASPPQRRDVYRTRLLMTAAILARAGRPESARSLLRTFEATRQGPVDLDGFAADEAYVRLLAGQEDAALALLQTFLHNNWSQRGYLVRTPWFRSLHGNPRFVALTERRP